MICTPREQGLVRLLQARRVQRRFRIPAPIRLVAGSPMAAPQAPPEHLERHPPPVLRRRMVASQPRPGTVQPSRSAHHALPLPGTADTRAMAGRGLGTPDAPGRDLGSARCGESRTAGAGGGTGKPNGGNTGRAPRADLTAAPRTPACATCPARLHAEPDLVRAGGHGLRTDRLDGDARPRRPARAWEPKRLRLRLFTAAGRLARGGRRLRLRLAATWPWATQITAAITRLQDLAPG
jgi:hypothetical protein